MNVQLLATKLYAPPLRPGLVHRPRLLERMSLGLQEGSLLTLITAPAGYGKTTLALEWLSNLGQVYSWLSLDRADNRPIQFFAYLIAALGQVDEKVGQRLQSILEEHTDDQDGTWIESFLEAFVNQLADVRVPFTLVLDDYHSITDLTIHQALEFVLEHRPPQMHLIIITRQDPFLPLSKLRSRGQLTEIRLGDLRFTQEETDDFLNEGMRLRLLPEEVAALQIRTEGWIAGLQLAAISLSESPAWSPAPLDPEARSKYIRAFAGDDRHVADYLLDEVLSRQPEEMQRFLLSTSLLGRLCGSLCDALLGGESKSSQRILESLERSNLFIIPLDNRRQWYRYHHLFADLLRNRLQSFDPALIPALHHRASEWFESANMIDEAVDHALLAEDFGRALGLIEHDAITSVWTSGDLLALLNWFKRLPEDDLIKRPRLCLYFARALFFAGQHLETADRYLNEAERVLRNQLTTPEGEVWGLLLTNQAAFAAMRGKSQKALDLVRQAGPLIKGTDYSGLARLGHAEGMAFLLLGAVHDAEAAFRKAIIAGRQSGNRNLTLDCVSCLALAQILSGELHRAIHNCQEALDEGIEIQRAPAGCTVRLALANALYEQNMLSASQDMLEMDLGASNKFGRPHILWQAYLLTARVRHALGYVPGAFEALDQAAAAAALFHFDYASRMVSACRARIELAQGNLKAAVRWAEEFQPLGVAVQSQSIGMADFEELTFARVLLSEGKFPEALSTLNFTINKASLAGRIASVMEADVVKAQVLGALGESDAETECLINAVQLAEPEGFARIFLNEGEGTAAALARIRRLRIPANIMRYSGMLLHAFEEGGLADLSSKASDALAEPLSERELEVLRLIADGLSNPEIAGRLYLSVNTLRAHTTHIYQKLDVHNRMQAAARAEELGLLNPK